MPRAGGRASLDRSHQRQTVTQFHSTFKDPVLQAGNSVKNSPLLFLPRNDMNSVRKTPSSRAPPGPVAADGAAGKGARCERCRVPRGRQLPRSRSGEGTPSAGLLSAPPAAEPLPPGPSRPLRRHPIAPSYITFLIRLLFLSVLLFRNQAWNL